MTNLSDLKEYLKISGSELDTFLQKAIEFTTEKMSAYCRRNLRYGSRYKVISGDCGNETSLDSVPVDYIEYIRYRDESSFPPGGGHGQFNKDLFNGENPNDNIWFDEQTGRLILLKGRIFPEGNSNIEIKYFAGYTVSAINPVNETPEDLKSVCLMASAEFYLKSFQGEGRLGLHSRAREEPESKLKQVDVFKDENYNIILDRYRKIKI